MCFGFRTGHDASLRKYVLADSFFLIQKKESMKIASIVLVVMLCAVNVFASEGRYVQQIALPDGRVAVVAEGDMEPRSVGSYSVRIYGARNPNFPFDDFQGGIIRSRNGVIEKVELADVDSNGTLELIVIVRSVGTGGYLSADAFNCAGKEPVLLASVKDLGKEGNAVEALRCQARKN